MPDARIRHFLPALMGSLHQQKAEGELVLEQNDGTRRLYWAGGDLKYLRSDAVGEQFGNFLIRRGVLDMAALKELLADGEGSRMGDRVVQWGLMTQEECDERLHELLGSILLHAMEHQILKMKWLPGDLGDNLSGDLQFRLDHRWLVWDTFQSAKIDRELIAMFRSEPDWRWKAPPNLLETLSNLPLTPTLAYALSLLGTEPLGFNTLEALTGLPQEEATRLVATLWAMGGLSLVQGDLPLLPKETLPTPNVVPEFEPEVEITLVEEEFQDSPDTAESPRPLTLMDVLEMDVPTTSRDPFSPAGPPLPRDPFSPAGPPPTRTSFPPTGPASVRHLPPAPLPQPGSDPTDSFSQHEQGTPPSESLPLMPSEEDLSAVERARQLLVKAKSYIMQDRTSEAIRALEQAIKIDGDSPGAFETWMLLGRLRLSNPAWSTRAIEALQVASRLDPRAAEPWALMGELYRRKGFHANAQGCFRRALELDPSVAVPSGWAAEIPTAAPPKDTQSGLMDKLRGMFGRERG